MQRLENFLLSVNHNRPTISRRLNVLLLGFLQTGGGLILLNTDYTWGTPGLITKSGIITMPVFSLIMLFGGVVTLLFGVFALHKVNAALIVILTIPFISYVSFSLSGVLTSQQPAQGAFFYFVTYCIAINNAWGAD